MILHTKHSHPEERLVFPEGDKKYSKSCFNCFEWADQVTGNSVVLLKGCFVHLDYCWIHGNNSYGSITPPTRRSGSTAWNRIKSPSSYSNSSMSDFGRKEVHADIWMEIVDSLLLYQSKILANNITERVGMGST